MNWVFNVLIGLVVMGVAGTSRSEVAPCTLKFQIEGAIGIGTMDLVERAFHKAQEQSCGTLFIAINTPGGNLQTTRLIVEKILNSPLPVMCLVTPAGAHAGSAGAIILQACHVAGAIAATNIGAATPILGTGQEMPEDLRKKMINDTVAWVEGLAQHNKRDRNFAKEIVTLAKAVSAPEALKLGAIDAVVQQDEEFVKFSEGRNVTMAGGKSQVVKPGPIYDYPLDMRYKVLSLVSDPELVYLIFLGSLGLLYFEITHTGFLLPGILGALGLVVSLVSFHKLQVEWGGLLLIFLGVAFLIAEIFVTSFGILGIGGVVSFVLGGLFLFYPPTSGYSLPVRLVLTTGISIGLSMLALAFVAIRTRGLKTQVGVEDMIGKIGKVAQVHESGLTGQVDVHGEIWNFESLVPMKIGQKIQVSRIDDLTVQVEPWKG